MGEAKLDRGAYLVEALAHCGACHTPRNFLFAERGYDSRSTLFLNGAMLGNWPAPDLRGPSSMVQESSAAALADYLSGGRNATSGAAGEMGLAIEHSLQYLPPEDLSALVSYVRAVRQERNGAITSTHRATPAATTAKLSEASPQLDLGSRLYLDNCNACHFVDGKGAASTFPQLDRNALVTALSPNGLIVVILDGAEMPSTASRPARLRMPGFGWRLTDEEVATLATFVRQGWSNNAAAVTPSDVAAVRKKLKSTAASQQLSK